MLLYGYESAGNVICITMRGRWTERLPEEFMRVCKTYDKILIKCENLNYISTDGLKQLFILTQKGKQVDLIGTSDAVKRIIDITGFGQDVNVY